MALYCPLCMKSMTPTFDGRAICPNHGNHHRLLYVRDPSILPVRSNETPLSPEPQYIQQTSGDDTYELANTQAPPTSPVCEALCKRHPDMPAVAHCRQCRAAVCNTCDFAYADGSHLCPDCAAGPSTDTSGSVIPTRELDSFCVSHPDVLAVAECSQCGTPVCSTCVFTYPGNLHLCPSCATNPVTKMSKSRKMLALFSIALGMWSIVLTAAVFAGLLQSMAEKGEDAFGVFLMLIVIIPSVIGIGLGVSAREKNRSNSGILWVGIISNAIVLCLWIFLIIVGLLGN